MIFMDVLLFKVKDVIWIIDEDFNIIEINDVFFEIIGY